MNIGNWEIKTKRQKWKLEIEKLDIMEMGKRKKRKFEMGGTGKEL